MSNIPLRPRAKVLPAKVPSAIAKLQRRIHELDELDPIGDFSGAAKIIADRANGTIDLIFGIDSAEAIDFRINPDWFLSTYTSDLGKMRSRFLAGRERARTVLHSAQSWLSEIHSDAEESAAEQTLRAYEGLSLHPEIARAASDLYRNGHHSNAIVDAVKALNDLIRLRSGLEIDGTALMEKAFSPKTPLLRFNELKDQSDIDEQRGFMMMFSGAVAGLRNPRAHRLIEDDAERALEFIAYVSLLAKLLDEAKRSSPSPP